MSNEERVLSALQREDEAVCDDCLSRISGVRPRQQVNKICNSLHRTSRVERDTAPCVKCGRSKKATRLPKAEAAQGDPERSPDGPVQATGPPWHCERNVQARVVAHLSARGYSILAVADTAARSPGKDIVAVAPDGRELWVSVKGYREKSPNMQARHSFAEALLDLVLYRGENPQVDLAVALPDGFRTYLGLAPRVNWLRCKMPFRIYWVAESGKVRSE